MTKEKKKKILITIASLRLGGGAERIASILGTELYKRDYDVHFLTFYDREKKYEFKGKYTSLKEKDSENILVKMWKLVYRAYKISQYCKKNKIDTSIGFMEEANFPLALSKYFGNKPKRIVSEQINPLFWGKSYQYLIKMLYPHEITTTCSKKIEQLFKRKYCLKKVKTIYNMQDVDKNIENTKHKIPKEHEHFFENNKTIITMGRLVEQKAHWNLIRSFSEVVKQEPRARLVILGEGKLRPKLEKLIVKENLQENVFLPGNVNNVFPYLKRAKLFVLNSLWEGLPLTMIEVLSTGTPIISTDCNTGPREILAPELNIDKKIKYPYEGRFGILTKTPTYKQIWKSTKEIPLQENEKQISDEMMKGLKKSTFKKGELVKRAYDFDKSNIIKEWEEVI